MDGHRLDRVQFHFHEGSEHTVDGRAYDGEPHLVHSEDAGATAVVGVLFDIGQEDAALDECFASLPQTPEAEPEIPDFDTAALLPSDHSTYRCTGSLTTPPCTQGCTGS